MDTPWWAVVSVIINFLILCVVLVYLYKKYKHESMVARLGGEEYAEAIMLRPYENIHDDNLIPLDTDE